jgi:AcrR family transcriptional regulator
MRDIAKSVGIQAPSLYNHFKSKEDIFNSIIDEMSKRYHDMAVKNQVPRGEMNDIVEAYVHVTTEDLVEIAQKMIIFMIKYDFALKYRKLLTIEQFRSAKAGQAFQDFFVQGALHFESNLFKEMMKYGVFMDCDPLIMAYHFYGPIFLMMNQFHVQDGSESEALDMVSRHVKQFSKIYVKHLRENK